MEKPLNILITSVGRRTYLVNYFKAALAGAGRVHVSNAEYTLAMDAGDAAFLTPLIYDPAYIPALLDYCNAHEITAILSLFDPDLLVLAENAACFEASGIRLILAPAESIRTCNDKWQTWRVLTAHGIGTPQTRLSIEAALEAVQDGTMHFPLIIKPRWGVSSLGIFCADDEAELRLFAKKSTAAIFGSHLKYELNRTPDAPIVIQQFLNAQEYGLDVLNDLDGRYVRTYAKQKVEMRAGETNVGRTVSPGPFEAMGRSLSTLIGHQGILSVDCMQTENGDLAVTDLNCRISGHYPVSHLAGVDFPRQLITWLRGGKTDPALLHCEEDLWVTKDLLPCRLNPKNPLKPADTDAAQGVGAGRS